MLDSRSPQWINHVPSLQISVDHFEHSAASHLQLILKHFFVQFQKLAGFFVIILQGNFKYYAFEAVFSTILNKQYFDNE